MPISETVSSQVKSIFSIQIDYDWSAHEFASLFDTLNRLYEFNRLLYHSLTLYNIQGEEFSWDKKLNELPQIFEIRAGLISGSYRIFNLYNLPSSSDIFAASNFHFGIDSLEVKKIKFGSRGSIDFVGLGKIFEVIKDLVIHYFPSKDDKIDTLVKLKEIEEREQKILQMKIENLRKIGISQNEIMTIIGMESFHINNIKKLQDEGKIIDIEIKNFLQ
ncbi:MAG: hypothetical protein ABI723_21585 [Bacteroidia bacterium]